MIGNIFISPVIEEATKRGLEADPLAKEIDEINKAIETKAFEIARLTDDLNRVKIRRASIPIKWRNAILWCLTIDSDNKRFFLKNTAGMYNCIAYKNKLDITPDMKNKVAVTLAGLFKNGVIGRVPHEGTFYYGLKKFFKENLTELEDLYKDDFDKIIK